jgi:DNA replicative helicase MCM subunit Mcm2 (Cdc46/Mcm family)
MKDLPTYCPQCMKKWTRRQSPWFRHLEYVHCENCKANAETIMKRCEKNSNLVKKKETKSNYNYGDWGYWGSSGDWGVD